MWRKPCFPWRGADMKEAIRARPHGVGIRGADLSRSSPLFEGPFGRMFRALPPADFGPDDAASQAALAVLASKIISPKDPADPKDGADPEESGIPSAYTYFGQFIDHDLTFDPVSSLQRQDDPDALVDFRTPRFDLDCVYGRGPDDQPYLYRADGLRMLQGDPLTGNPDDTKARGVPRETPEPGEPARALLGDPRNDEIVIVSQLQASMLRFHNRMVDVLGSDDFEQVQQAVRW